MDANDVYNIAKALPQEELIRLCNMLDISVRSKTKIKKKRKALPEFTVNDGIRYLLKHHFNKIKSQ